MKLQNRGKTCQDFFFSWKTRIYLHASPQAPPPWCIQPLYIASYLTSLDIFSLYIASYLTSLDILSLYIPSYITSLDILSLYITSYLTSLDILSFAYLCHCIYSMQCVPNSVSLLKDRQSLQSKDNISSSLFRALPDRVDS